MAQPLSQRPHHVGGRNDLHDLTAGGAVPTNGVQDAYFSWLASMLVAAVSVLAVALAAAPRRSLAWLLVVASVVGLLVTMLALKGPSPGGTSSNRRRTCASVATSSSSVSSAPLSSPHQSPAPPGAVGPRNSQPERPAGPSGRGGPLGRVHSGFSQGRPDEGLGIEVLIETRSTVSLAHVLGAFVSGSGSTPRSWSAGHTPLGHQRLSPPSNASARFLTCRLLGAFKLARPASLVLGATSMQRLARVR